jgi:hypothetical protein
MRRPKAKGKKSSTPNTRIAATENNGNNCVVCEVNYCDEKKWAQVDW